jgi:hypothetical protein
MYELIFNLYYIYGVTQFLVKQFSIGVGGGAVSNKHDPAAAAAADATHTLDEEQHHLDEINGHMAILASSIWHRP